MCKGIFLLHAECRHQKKFETLSLCADYSTTEERCTGTCLVTGKVIIDAPALCRTCYVSTEKVICKRCKESTTMLEKEVQMVDVVLESDMDRVRRKDLQGHRTLLLEKIRELKAEREEELKEFRTRQKVWGDG